MIVSTGRASDLIGIEYRFAQLMGDRRSQWRPLDSPLERSSLASLRWYLEPLAPLDERLQEASQPLADIFIHEFQGKIVPSPREIWAAASLTERCKSNDDHEPVHGTSRIGPSVPCACS